MAAMEPVLLPERPSVDHTDPTPRRWRTPQDRELTGRRFGGCPLGWVGVVAMLVALVVTSVLTVTASAQLPSTSSTPASESGGGGGTVGLVVFAVVVTIIIGTAIVLYLRHRGGPPARQRS